MHDSDIAQCVTCYVLGCFINVIGHWIGLYCIEHGHACCILLYFGMSNYVVIVFSLCPVLCASQMQHCVAMQHSGVIVCYCVLMCVHESHTPTPHFLRVHAQGVWWYSNIVVRFCS